jgi:hypothetical protein
MYIEDKSGPDGLVGQGRIGLVTFTKTGKSIHYNDRLFLSLKGRGFKANYQDAETGDQFWISGCKKDGQDTLYGGIVEIDENIREQYWVEICNRPERKHEKSYRG